MIKYLAIIGLCLITNTASAANWTPLQTITKNLCEKSFCLGIDNGNSWNFSCTAPVTVGGPNEYYATFMSTGCYCPCPSYNYDWFKTLSEESK